MDEVYHADEPEQERVERKCPARRLDGRLHAKEHNHQELGRTLPVSVVSAGAEDRQVGGKLAGKGEAEEGVRGCYEFRLERCLMVAFSTGEGQACLHRA